MDKIESFYNQNSERKILNPFKVEKKFFYPIIDISVVHGKNIIYGVKIDPIAFIVEENGNKYIIPLTDKNMDINALYLAVSAYDGDIKSV